MKKKKAWVLIAILILLLALFFFNIDTSKETVIYHVPEGFKGCATIYYSQKGQEPLNMENNNILIEIPKDGKVLTSTL